MSFDDLFLQCLILSGAIFLSILIGAKIIQWKSLNGQGISLIGLLTLICCALGFLGISVGVSMGLSSSPVVGVILPGIVTFASALVSIFLIKSKEETKFFSQIVAALGLSFLCYYMVKGAELGSNYRINYQETHNPDGSIRDNKWKQSDTVMSKEKKKFLDSVMQEMKRKPAN